MKQKWKDFWKDFHELSIIDQVDVMSIIVRIIAAPVVLISMIFHGLYWMFVISYIILIIGTAVGISAFLIRFKHK